MTSTLITIFSGLLFAPPPASKKKVHFGRKSSISDQANNPKDSHACRMSCDLSELLEQTKPPDPELVDLIERSYLEGQIDGETQSLAFVWLESNDIVVH